MSQGRQRRDAFERCGARAPLLGTCVVGAGDRLGFGAVMTPLDIDSATQSLLDRYGFDRALFERLRGQLRRGEVGDERNRITGRVEPPLANELVKLATADGAQHARWVELGKQAIARGQVGCVVLAGGMATRFGGVVKAVVEALPGHTFLQLKLRQISAAAKHEGAKVPVYLMTSFSTDSQLRELAAMWKDAHVNAECFAQLISLRLTPEGELYRDASGDVSPYAPGHGDLTFALRSAGVLSRFVAAGGRYLYVSNVDNLAATLDPAVIGFHIASGAQITTETVAKDPGDKGGAPGRVDGRIQVIEDFRFPRDFDQDSIRVFNANSFVMDAAAIDRDFPLDWFAVKKTVDGATVIQFEHLVGQVTAFLRGAYLEVPRRGSESRFLPVKDPDELKQRQDEIRQVMQARGGL